MAKNSGHIRIRYEDKKIWKEYCRALGEPSPELFSKIIKSKELNLNQRIINEYQKKQTELRRKLNL